MSGRRRWLVVLAIGTTLAVGGFMFDACLGSPPGCGQAGGPPCLNKKAVHLTPAAPRTYVKMYEASDIRNGVKTVVVHEEYDGTGRITKCGPCDPGDSIGHRPVKLTSVHGYLPYVCGWCVPSNYGTALARTQLQFCFHPLDFFGDCASDPIYTQDTSFGWLGIALGNVFHMNYIDGCAWPCGEGAQDASWTWDGHGWDHWVIPGPYFNSIQMDDWIGNWWVADYGLPDPFGGVGATFLDAFWGRINVQGFGMWHQSHGIDCNPLC